MGGDWRIYKVGEAREKLSNIPKWRKGEHGNHIIP